AKRDWSSDVCSSDLPTTATRGRRAAPLTGVVAGTGAASGVEAIPEVYTVPCMDSQSCPPRVRGGAGRRIRRRDTAAGDLLRTGRDRKSGAEGKRGA